MTDRSVSAAELGTLLTPYAEAVSLVVGNTQRLQAVSVPVADADGLVLAHDVIAQNDLPRWNNSSMDGYAVLSADTVEAPVELELLTIMTGNPMPASADAVVPWEYATSAGGKVRIEEPVIAGSFVRFAGEDARKGDIVARVGERIAPIHLGLLAALGNAEVSVYRRPCVTVVCTGDEIVPAGAPLGDTQIYDANGVMLPALLRRAGAEVVTVRYARDDREAVRKQLLAAAAESDVIVTTGGASVGVHDWVRAVVEEEGAVELWRVAVRPGKPFAYGHVGGTPTFVLPGNPASVAACLHAFTLPALRVMAGKPAAHRVVSAVMTDEIMVTGDRTFLCPVVYANGSAAPVRSGSSSVLSNQLLSNGFVVCAPGLLNKESVVEVELTD